MVVMAKAFSPDPAPMRRAIREARRNLRSIDGGPFGACVVRGGEVVAAARNTVLRDRDATRHAEVNAIRAASRRLRTRDLSDCVIYSTTEPCPMCFGAIHWAGIRTIVAGTGIPDARRAGFRELLIPDRALMRLGRSRVRLIEGFLYDECVELFRAWVKTPGRQSY